MKAVFNDKTKFSELRSVNKFDSISKTEQAYQLKLRNWFTKGFLSKYVYELIRATGSQCHKLYGLPKTHEVGCPTRPILDMINAPQYQIVKYLITVLQPLSKKVVVIVLIVVIKCA